MATILKNWHVSYDTLSYPKYLTSDRAFIKFTPSCRYNLGDDDQLDWNKLFGFSTQLLPSEGIRPSHCNSVRFGWRYNKEADRIEVCAYYYINKVRHYAENSGGKIASLEIDKTYFFEIIPNNAGGYLLLVSDNHGVSYFNEAVEVKQSIFGWHLCFFFGGNESAPQKITAIMERF